MRFFCTGRRLVLGHVTGVICLAFSASAKTYEVGPKESLKRIADVPWEMLEAGDTVEIHWRTEPYREKFVIGRQGQEKAPITVRGVLGPKGERPVISGENATTRPELRYWGDARSVIKIGGGKVPADTFPQYIVLENLEITGGRPPNTFTAADGTVKPYQRNAAGLHVEKAKHLTVRNCVFQDNGNGLFVSSNNDQASQDILIERCHIYNNGNLKSGYEHGVYTEAINITFQENHFGPMREGCPGALLKDRSAGLVVRYNWLEGGERPLDLVEAEDSKFVRESPAYATTQVYGNVIIMRNEAYHRSVVHYGGDSRRYEIYRKGTLYFHHNTVICRHKTGITLVDASTNDEKVDCRNNLLYFGTLKPKRPLCIGNDKGTYTFADNWVQTGWTPWAGPKPDGTFTASGHNTEGTDPGFVDEAKDDFHLRTDAAARDVGGPAAKGQPVVNREYVRPQSSRTRAQDRKPDAGAYEFGSK